MATETYSTTMTQNTFLKKRTFFVVFAFGLIGFLFGAWTNNTLMQRHHSVAMELQLSKEWSLLDRFANETYRTHEMEQNLLVHEMIISLADSRRNAQWISEEEYSRIVGFSNARLVAIYLDQGHQDKAAPYLEKALKLLNQGRIKPLSETELIELMRNINQP